MASPSLRHEPVSLRLALSAMIFVLFLGYAASGAHMKEHHGPRDGDPKLSRTDIEGVYSGVRVPSPLRTALERGHGEGLTAVEQQALLSWLSSARIVEDWDNLDLGDLVPADLLAERCAACHFRSAPAEARQEPLLEYLDDIRRVAFDQELAPTDPKLLLASTHAHSLALFSVSALLILLLLKTRFRARLSGPIALALSAGLLLDLLAWWAARENPAWIQAILLGGVLHAGAVLGAGLLILIDLWAPRRTERQH